MRLAIVLLLLASAPALAQVKKDKDDKVSNDDPARPLQMPPASTEVKEAIEDFERFQRRGAWERALKALYTIPEAQALRFVDGENGFIIPVERKRRADPRRPAAGRSGGLSVVLRRRGEETARRGRRAVGAEEPRAHLLRLFHHVRRRQCRRSAGRSLLRARAIRPRRRLLAGHPARTPRHGPVAGPALGEGRAGPVPGGTPVRVRAGPRRAGGSLRRREGHDRGADRRRRASS